MGIQIKDPGEEARKEAEHKAAMDRAMQGNGKWPIRETSEDDLKYQSKIASSEPASYRNFTQPGQFPSFPMHAREEHEWPCEAAQPIDEAMPSRSSFEQDANTQPFQLGPVKGK